MTKTSVEDFFTFFIINNDIEKYITEYKNQYNHPPTRDRLFNFILEQIPMDDYTQEEQEQFKDSLDFQLFNYFDEEQDHTEDIYNEFHVPSIEPPKYNLFKLKELRLKLNLTQIEIAKNLHTDRRNIKKWESGLILPNTKHLIKLAELFECTTDYLLSRSNDFGDAAIKEKSPSHFLKPEEQELLDNFRSLPKTEQTQASEYVQYLADKRGKKKPNKEKLS